MRLATTLFALLLFSNLIISCTVDPIDEDSSINQTEDVRADGGDDTNPPVEPPGGNG